MLKILPVSLSSLQLLHLERKKAEIIRIMVFAKKEI